ncbi:hypothetical protein [Paraburkholderia sp. BL21I4N1]|uniref:hypothetical protein n=1 Tax=Paraburkholderia sp. BL21I4N1 TaxID=1938801 RepID=UPI0011B2476E|nr:hypothetical protein [Paraburkholderia sp. BL21I4N1]
MIHLSIEDGHADTGNAMPPRDLPAAYIAHPSGTLRSDLVHPGVQIDEKGRRYISDGKHAYAIRFDRDHRTERVYQPDNPAKPGIPVRLNQHGDYERHDEVGLKGGSLGQDLTRKLAAAEQRLEQARTTRRQAQNELTAINAQVRAADAPSANLRQAQQDAQRRSDDSRLSLAVAEGGVEGVRREVQALRQSAQQELADKRRHREDGRQLERTTQLEIDVIVAAADAARHASENTLDRLRKLRDDLRRIQAANNSLDAMIGNMTYDLNDFPRV